jgi:DNA-binding MarR family transcriptional regulator
VPEATRTAKEENAQIVLGLLDLVERDGAQSQRRLAEELGIALGLVNAYLKRCVSKGLVKIRYAPARRYAYYLTPKGFAEKSRLTVNYLTYSLSFFRQAKVDCVGLFETARRSGFTRIALIGQSDLAEIALICAIESGIEIVVIIDASSTQDRFVGVPVAKSFEAVEIPFEAAVITDLEDAAGSVKRATAHLGSDRVLVPGFLRVTPAAIEPRQ